MDLSENMKCWCCYCDIKLDRCCLILAPIRYRKHKGSKRHPLCEECYSKVKRFLEIRRGEVVPELRRNGIMGNSLINNEIQNHINEEV